jgi:hypothetical protein
MLFTTKNEKSRAPLVTQPQLVETLYNGLWNVRSSAKVWFGMFECVNMSLGTKEVISNLDRKHDRNIPRVLSDRTRRSHVPSG